MRLLPVLIFVGAALGATPVLAQAPANPSAQVATLDNGGREVVPDVAPGDEIVIACAPIEQRNAGSDVRVVLTISAMPNDVPPGYKKVLATDQELGKYGVKVRVPDVPDLPDHTVNLDVYVVGSNSSRGCDGGHVRVVQRGLADFRHEAKSPHVS